MGRSTSGLALKAIGALLLAFLALAVVGAVLAIVATVIRILVLFAALAFFGALLYWLAKRALGGGESDSQSRQRVPAPEQHERTTNSADDGSWRERLPGIGGDSDSTEERTATERLRQRYVDGDISEEEFERQLQILLATEDDPESIGERSRERERERERL